MVSPTPLLKAIRPLAIVAAALFAGAASAGDFEDMVAAERAFAADASARNTREAFLAAYDEDGIAFVAGPRNAKRVWEARPENKNKLEWAPEVAEIAASGELGYTSGPWRFTREGDEQPTAFGHFFTIWRKDADGKWKVLVDHGVSHAQVAFPDKVTRRGGIGAGTPPTWRVGIDELRKADLYDRVSQAFAVFLPVKSVGVVGDARAYEWVIALRAVETIDFMTAHWAHLPYEFLGKVSNRIINELRGVSRVVYDISGKPPATIEWE